jgi:AraC family transcriptional activator of pobA
MVLSANADPHWERLGATMTRLLEDYRAGISSTLAALLAVAFNDIALLAQNGAEATSHESAGLATSFRRLVDQHFRENWTISQYLDALGTTPHLLTKSVRRTYGRAPKSLIEDRRLVEAKRLLLFTVRSVEDVGYEIGFQDPAYFSRFFRQKTGSPPGLWRLQGGT